MTRGARIREGRTLATSVAAHIIALTPDDRERRLLAEDVVRQLIENHDRLEALAALDQPRSE